MGRGQAAMEFVMTYGWAILVVIVAIGALTYFGVFNAKEAVPQTCVASAGFGCSDMQIISTGNQVTVRTYLDVGGYDIRELNVTAELEGSTADCDSPNTVNVGERALIECTVTATVEDYVKVTLNGTYVIAGKTYTRTLDIEMSGKVERGPDVCGDGQVTGPEVCDTLGNIGCSGGDNCVSCSSCVPPGPTCGDASCDVGEDCASCPGDCGCSPGEGCCGAVCVDVTVDPNNCGSCGNACGGSYQCVSSSCEYCGDGAVNGGEVCDTNGDLGCSGGETCNGCSVCDPPAPFCGDLSCNGGETCASCPGDCGCSPGEGCCGAVCVDVTVDPNNCGSCGNVCGGTYQCVSSSCQYCGDGSTNGGEECDDGAGNGVCPAACSASCTTNSCSSCGPFQPGSACTGSEIWSSSVGNNMNTCEFMCTVVGGGSCCRFLGGQDVDCFLYDGPITPGGGWAAPCT